MTHGKLDTTRVVRLLLQDALPMLGERARAEIGRLGENYEERAREWIEAGDRLDDAQRAFDAAVVDGLQQTAHDCYWDTTWPACPVHPHHPLWYDESEQVWYCREDTAIRIPLGRLAASNDPGT